MQELGCPLLERSRQRGRLLIAEQVVHNVVWDSGPADELRLGRRERGHGLWCGTDPQEACFRILLDRRIKHLCEERRQRIIPTDDRRQIRLLCGDAITTHGDLLRRGWCEAVPWCRWRWPVWCRCTRDRPRPGGCPWRGVTRGCRAAAASRSLRPPRAASRSGPPGAGARARTQAAATSRAPGARPQEDIGRACASGAPP